MTLLCISTGSNARNVTPLNDRKPRQSTLGFTFVPPPGNNWLEEFKDDTVLYMKATSNKTNSFFASATEFHTKTPFPTANDFLNFVKSSRIPKTSSERFKNAQWQYKLDLNFAPFCVRYHEKYEDHGTKYLNKRKYLIVENFGLFCLHLENKEVGVNIYYSERYEEGYENLSLHKEGYEFINSLKFIPIKK